MIHPRILPFHRLGALAGVCAAMCWLAPAAMAGAESSEEDKLIQVLRSDSSLHEKDAACARLKRIGTARSVPALATLLTPPDLSHSALAAATEKTIGTELHRREG